MVRSKPVPERGKKSVIRMPSEPRLGEDASTFVELIIDRKTGHLRQAGSDGPGPAISDFRSRAEKSLYTFAIGVMGFVDLTAELHAPICYLLGNPMYRRVNIGLPRDCYKTSTLLAFALHTLIQPAGANIYFPLGVGSDSNFDGSDVRLLWVGETSVNGKKNVGFLMRHLEHNQILRALWPHRVWENAERQAPRWSLDEGLIIPRSHDYPDATITPAGVDVAREGGHFTVHVFDDVATRRAKESPTVMKKTIDWIRTAKYMELGVDTTRVASAMTHWAIGDPMDYWEKHEPYDEKSGRGMFQYFRTIIEDGESILPSKFPMEAMVYEQRTDPETFAAHRMNNPLMPELLSFDPSHLRSCEIGPWEDLEDSRKPLRVFFRTDLRDDAIRETMLGPALRPERQEPPPVRDFYFPRPRPVTAELLDLVLGPMRDEEDDFELLASQFRWRASASEERVHGTDPPANPTRHGRAAAPGEVAEAKIWDRYMIYDPAGSRKTKDHRRSKSACVVLGYDEWGRIFVLENWSSREPLDIRLERIVETWIRTQPLWLGIERFALQEELQKLIAMVIAQRGIPISTLPITQPGGQLDKDHRIRSVIRPVMAVGKLFVPEQFVELRNEIRGHPTTVVKDNVDVLATGIPVLPPRYLHETAQDGTPDHRLIAYLRKGGLDPRAAFVEAEAWRTAYDYPD